MAFVIPAVISIGGAMAGGAAFGAAVAGVASTFAGFMSVAGAVLGSLGVLTGNKGLKKLGSIMALTGGVAGLAQSAFGAASAAGEAAAGAEALGEASGQWASGAADAAGAAEGAQALGQTGSLGSEIGNLGFDAAPVELGGSLSGNQLGLSGIKPVEPTGGMSDLARTYASTPTDGFKMPSLLQQAAANTNQAEIAALGKSTANTAQSLWDQAGAALKGTGKFIKDNKELVSLGGNMLSSMYGPEAERLDYQKSLMERARRNLNQPVRLKYQGGG